MNQMISTPALASVGAEMENWLGGWATKLSPADWAAALDPLASDLICEAVRDVGGTEGSLWIADASQSALVPVFNTGPRAAEFVLKFAQPLSLGIIAMVHANQMPVIEGDVAEASRQDPTLDQRLGVRTTSLLAVPFQFAGCPLGVLSAVMLETPGREKLGNFAPEAIVTFERMAETLRRILEWRFMRIGMGISE